MFQVVAEVAYWFFVACAVALFIQLLRGKLDIETRRPKMTELGRAAKQLSERINRIRNHQLAQDKEAIEQFCSALKRGKGDVGEALAAVDAAESAREDYGEALANVVATSQAFID